MQTFVYKQLNFRIIYILSTFRSITTLTKSVRLLLWLPPQVNAIFVYLTPNEFFFTHLHFNCLLCLVPETLENLLTVNIESPSANIT